MRMIFLFVFSLFLAGVSCDDCTPHLSEYWLKLNKKRFTIQQKPGTAESPRALLDHKVALFYEGTVQPALEELVPGISESGGLEFEAKSTLRFLDTADFGFLRLGWSLVLREALEKGKKDTTQILSLAYHSSSSCDAFQKSSHLLTSYHPVMRSVVNTGGTGFSQSLITKIPKGKLRLPITIKDLKELWPAVGAAGISDETIVTIVRGKELVEYLYKPLSPFPLLKGVPTRGMLSLWFDSNQSTRDGPNGEPLLTEFGFFFEEREKAGPISETAPSKLSEALMDVLLGYNAWFMKDPPLRTTLAYGEEAKLYLDGRTDSLRTPHGSGKLSLFEVSIAGSLLILAMILLLLMIGKWLNSDYDAPSLATRRHRAYSSDGDDPKDNWTVFQDAADGKVRKRHGRKMDDDMITTDSGDEEIKELEDISETNAVLSTKKDQIPTTDDLI